MASLYKETNWPSKLEAVKYDFIQKLVDRGFSFKDKISKLQFDRHLGSAIYNQDCERGERNTNN